MVARRICTPSSRGVTEHPDMDVVSVLLAVAMFAVMFAIVAGIERI